jgi:hypothetical protein
MNMSIVTTKVRASDVSKRENDFLEPGANGVD